MKRKIIMVMEICTWNVSYHITLIHEVSYYSMYIVVHFVIVSFQSKTQSKNLILCVWTSSIITHCILWLSAIHKSMKYLLMFHMWLFVWDVLRCATCIHVIAAVYSLSYYKKWICCSFLSIWLVKIQLRSHYSWSNSSFTLTHAMKYMYVHHTIFDKCCRFQNVCVHVCMLNTCLSVYDSVLA